MRYDERMENGDDELLTIPEAAERLGLSPGTLAIQARKGVLRARKMGPIYVVTLGEVKRYERENKGKPGPPRGPRKGDSE